MTQATAAPRRGRGLVGVMLIVSLLATIAMQTLGRAYHDRLMPRRTTSRISGLDSFTLGLLLGGLRGPLVMILWTSSEAQKTEKNLENVETQIELIRMLQPEFDSVHIFQMWNKAYNLSVQMASLPNRYSTILDAIRYGKSVDAERHDDINIMVSIAEIYYNKFGTGADRHYYTDRVRRETRHQAIPPRQTDASLALTSHAELLDEQGKILPKYQQELRYLLPYDDKGAFPDGVPPLALAYNYHKRAQQIMATTNQRHLQLSDAVVDSRPAVDLRTWAEEEWGRARTKELVSFHIRTREELAALDRITLVGLNFQTINLKQPAPDASEQAKAQIRLALFGYERCQQVCADAEAEYQRHIDSPEFAVTGDNYRSHVATMRALATVARADHDYLALAADRTGLIPLSQTMPGVKADDLLKRVQQEYQLAVDAYNRLLLRYYVDANVAEEVYPRFTKAQLGQSFSRAQIELAPPRIYPSLRAEAEKSLRAKNMYPNYFSDAEEFLNYISMCQQRLEQLKKP